MIQITKYLQIGCMVLAGPCLIGALFTLPAAHSRQTGVKLLLHGLGLIGCIIFLEWVKSHASTQSAN